MKEGGYDSTSLDNEIFAITDRLLENKSLISIQHKNILFRIGIYRKTFVQFQIKFRNR